MLDNKIIQVFILLSETIIVLLLYNLQYQQNVLYSIIYKIINKNSFNHFFF